MSDRHICKAKRTDNGEWAEGYYIKDEKDASKAYIGYLLGVIDGVVHDVDIVEVDPSTVCQCTVLPDKNGKKIWENDICYRKEKYPEIVKYHEGDWTLDYSYTSGDECGSNYCNLGFYVRNSRNVEVIGNIFDNPELLEGGAE